MNQTFVHMHEGETVYYEDACYVCESQQIKRDNMTQVSATEDAIPEPWTDIDSADPWPVRREFPWYEIRHAFQALAWLGAAYVMWLVAFILLSLLLHGSVKW